MILSTLLETFRKVTFRTSNNPRNLSTHAAATKSSTWRALINSLATSKPTKRILSPKIKVSLRALPMSGLKTWAPMKARSISSITERDSLRKNFSQFANNSMKYWGK